MTTHRSPPFTCRSFDAVRSTTDSYYGFLTAGVDNTLRSALEIDPRRTSYEFFTFPGWQCKELTFTRYHQPEWCGAIKSDSSGFFDRLHTCDGSLDLMDETARVFRSDPYSHRFGLHNNFVARRIGNNSELFKPDTDLHGPLPCVVSSQPSLAGLERRAA